MAKDRTDTEQAQSGATGQSDRTRGGQSDRSRANSLARRDPFSIGGSTNPFSLMRRFSDDMDRLFGDFAWGGSRLPDLFGRAESFGWTPQVDVFQRGNEFVVRADLPGLQKDDIEIDVTDDVMTLRGERKHEHEEEREGVWRSERSYGSFVRTIPLPEGAITDSAKATFNNGVLEIVMQAPPREASRGRRLEISPGASAESGNATGSGSSGAGREEPGGGNR